MQSRFLLTALAVLFALGIATVASAERGAGELRFGRIAELLDLDPDVAAAVDAIVEETRSEARALHEELWEERYALRELLSEDTPDVEAVMEQAERLGEIETAANKHRISAMLRIRSLLTPEQRAQLVAMRGERRTRALEACAGDVEAFCAETEPGRTTIRCLRRNLDELSAQCSDALPQRGLRKGPRDF